ncbi:hypothetical protein [Roseibium alexandrii]|uniref:hypothetical protein n=1 Tax=Roseibium alexandrii TaxID=388408 RepID=UPI0037507BFC
MRVVFGEETSASAPQRTQAHDIHGADVDFYKNVFANVLCQLGTETFQILLCLRQFFAIGQKVDPDEQMVVAIANIDRLDPHLSAIGA